MTSTKKPLAIPAIELKCTQCGEKMVSQRFTVALQTSRTSVELCTDCSVHDLPHTD